MITTKRFELAVAKLYNAFHSGSLNPDSCTQCAVGNILDNKDFWKHLSNEHGSLKLNYVGLVNQNLGKTFNGYSPIELLEIERAFLQACGYHVPIQPKQMESLKLTKDNLFDGLEAVVALLCKFDNIPNVMDCTKLFQFEKKASTTQVLEWA